MTPLLIRWAAAAAITALLVAVLRFRRTPRSFVVYVSVLWVSEIAVFLWPDQLFRYEVWAAQQLTYAALRLAVAVEMARIVFGAFPRAPRAWALLGFGIVVVAAGVLIPSPAESAGMCTMIVKEIVPRLSTISMWAFAGLALVALHWSAPMLWWERAILVGFALYLPVLAALLSWLGRWGWTTRESVGTISAVAWIAVCCWWTAAAVRGRT
jgi:hypothetical protein